ncbi:import receptor subunit tom40 [Anaeramoeba flamelloides]|uniref:Import receptor subunit tom40 n=1 Tax=Anaeramoeba flamelloides TaxID=1746091 RepID=A0ABQ8XMU5_9EUKA|nr:import receptor subunit tom40 [Anaeramoeba flamelloides]
MGQSFPINKQKSNHQISEPKPLTNLNPGKFNNYCTEANTILNVQSFDGFVLELHHNYNKQFSLSNNLTLGSLDQPSVYELETSFQNQYFSLIGNIDNNGFLRGNLLTKFNDKLFLDTTFNIHQNNKTTNSDGNYSFNYFEKYWTGNLELQSNQLVVLSYYQKLFKKLNLGVKYTYFIPEKESKLLYIGRYETEKNISTISYSDLFNYLAVSYVHKITPRVGFATEIVYSFRDDSSFTSLGIKYSLRKSSFQSRLTSNGEICSALELHFPKVTLGFSVKMDYHNEKYFAGVSAKIGNKN